MSYLHIFIQQRVVTFLLHEVWQRLWTRIWHSRTFKSMDCSGRSPRIDWQYSGKLIMLQIVVDIPETQNPSVHHWETEAPVYGLIGSSFTNINHLLARFSTSLPRKETNRWRFESLACLAYHYQFTIKTNQQIFEGLVFLQGTGTMTVLERERLCKPLHHRCRLNDT